MKTDTNNPIMKMEDKHIDFLTSIIKYKISRKLTKYSKVK